MALPFEPLLQKIKTYFPSKKDERLFGALYVWQVLIFVFILGLVFLMTISLYLFTTSDMNAEGTNTKDVRATKVLDLDKFDAIILQIQKRETVFNELLQNKPVVVDPSL